MHELMRKVKKELETIADKGISTSNLEITNKLVDIYKDLKETHKIDLEICKLEEENEDTFDANRTRDSRGRFKHHDDWDEYGKSGGNYGRMYMDERHERHFNRMKDGMEQYAAGRTRYREGGSHERMVEGVEMTMSAIVSFVESLVDFAETSEEKEIVRKHIEKLKRI